MSNNIFIGEHISVLLNFLFCSATQKGLEPLLLAKTLFSVTVLLQNWGKITNKMSQRYIDPV